PATEVLSRATGFVRNYSSDPYAGYADSPSVFFPLRHRPPADGELHLKERVLGLRRGGAAKAYPLSRLAAYGQSRIADEVGGEPVFIHWDAAAGAAWAADAAGQPLAAVDGYWFAWYAFHPATAVFAAPAPFDQ
ncbi:MAG: DUF3179 domain-containing protein, partial [Betaproteobacteria bacterium AqS2]|nr:DUF3179 domain-containing protein [Betaproteobacteria bacterium AqS2]